LIQETNMCIEVLQEAMHPDGFNVGMNLGASAGAGIKDHVHMHIVPRWTGDTNFMPVIGDTRVIVEALERSYEELKPLFECRCDADTLRRTLEGRADD
jgi:ATP adenylyltransferase